MADGRRARRPASQATGWFVHWLALVLPLAVVATVLDALLLERSRSFFTGGFLAADHITRPGEAASFLATSLLADVTLIGIAVAITLWVAGRTGLTRPAAALASAVVAIGPLMAANVVGYSLLAHLGDLFDARLMFDLTGRSPGEVMAVAWGPGLRAGALIAAGVVVLAGGVWMTQRWWPSGPRAPRIPGRPVIAVGLLLLTTGMVGTTAARLGSDVLDNGIRRKPSGQFLGTLVNGLTDVDRDGFGLMSRPPDPNLFDARIYPYALEIPGNGIDENGVGGDLPVGPPYVEPMPAAGPWRNRQDVVLIVLESFRADTIGATLHGRAVTPVLDALAARGVSVAHAWSHNGYTVQSRRHLFTGSVADLTDTTLIDDFNANGYETAYFSAQDESFGGPDRGVGFDRAAVAYDARQDRHRRYSTFTTAGSLAVSHRVLNARVEEFLSTRTDEAPLFLYVNYHDTHFPYHHGDIEPMLSDVVVPPQRLSPSREADLRGMYLNTAANVDRAIGELLARVTEALGREPGVVIVSDHGESLYEERFLGHGYALNDAQTRIPLIVVNLPAAIPEPFGQADLRHVLYQALDTEPGPPAIVPDRSRRIFQYLGRLERAAQIAWTTPEGRLLYDLRARQAKFGGGPWIADRQLTDDQRAAAYELVHTWERMLLARADAMAENGDQNETTPYVQR
jgi:hypothetical protein